MTTEKKRYDNKMINHDDDGDDNNDNDDNDDGNYN